jgi:hypothetical protein
MILLFFILEVNPAFFPIKNAGTVTTISHTNEPQKYKKTVKFNVAVFVAVTVFCAASGRYSENELRPFHFPHLT